MARHFTRSQKKSKLWGAVPAFSSGSISADVLLAGNSLAFTSPQTVIRMLGEYIITPTVAPAAGDRATWTVGLAKVSTDAFALGATALPNPASPRDFPWLYWAEHAFALEVADLSVASQGLGSVLRHSFDVRSMRKFTANESLGLVVEYTNFGGNPPMRFFSASTRVLTTIH